MVKRILFACLTMLPFMGMAQSGTTPLNMQMHNGKIYFDNAYALGPGVKKEELYNRALSWFKSAFPYPDKSINVTDEKKGEITGTGVFKIVTSAAGHYFWLKFTVNIIVHNSTYELKVYDLYEKPIEPGISNEYSKIEYRWWDYRLGKPWSAEDNTLFKTLTSDLTDMTASLQTDMSK